jgi:hypothetical protein
LREQKKSSGFSEYKLKKEVIWKPIEEQLVKKELERMGPEE